jgi:flagellar biosynthesis protein FlhF
MNIKRFVGKNSREALAMVRQALGDDAVIISNRAINGGNEIMAVSDQEIHAMANQQHIKTVTSKASAAHVELDDTDVELTEEDFANAPTLLSILNQNKEQAKPHAAIQATQHLQSTSVNEAKPRDSMVPDLAFVSPTQQIPTFSNEVLSEKINVMLSEMRVMRHRFESQMNAMTWNQHLQNSPIKAKMLSMLLAGSFSAALSRQLAEKLPNQLDMAKATNWIKAILAKNLNTINNESELLDQGGVFALVAPTGVGKTTTTAKLAARYVMKHGTQNLGLITTDGYRIGGHEQLRIYGKILGVMVYAVKDEADLKIALNELKNKHTILVDTVGVSQRDQMVTEQIAMLSNMNVNIKKLLCLNATNTGETLTDVVRAYKGRALDGCIITKLDEAASIGNVLDVVIREKIKLYYTTHGQRVPEDISLANKEKLINRALTLQASNWPFQFLDEELPFVVGNDRHAFADSEVKHV